MIKQALLSVSDKSGIVEFAKSLSELGVSLLSTGGTAKLLADAGLPVTEVADYTGFPEMLDGRVKTLHPKVHGGILARRDLPEHMAALEQHDIPTIDLLVVNLYPFVETVSKEECSLEDAIENIDIGGPTMLRSAAKNHRDVTVIVDPADYAVVLDEMRANWWRHLLVSIPLGWCGMWVGWLWSLLLVPLFGWACVRAARQSQPLLLLYAAPAIVMLGLHAAVANQSTRYNLILIGPFSVGAAWIISATLRNARWRSRALAPGP